MCDSFLRVTRNKSYIILYILVLKKCIYTSNRLINTIEAIKHILKASPEGMSVLIVN